MKFDYPLSLLTAFGVTVFLLFLLRPVAFRIGLVDKPDERKQHEGTVPLTGGLAMVVALSFSILTLNISIGWLRAFLAGALILVITGVLDDLHELSTTARFSAQIIATTIMALWGGVVLNDFGHLVSTAFVVELGWLAIPITAFSAIGVINAVNMLDGIDGLAGFVTLVAVAGMAIISFTAGETNILFILGLFAAVLAAFLIFNLYRNKENCSLVFMGDAGSMFLGFVLSWFLITLSQGDERAMSPVTALWLFAVPLFETLTMMIRRVSHGRSPFAADREHVHHMFELAGFSKHMTLLIIISASILFAVVGLLGHFLQILEPVMFYSFLAVFGGYLVFIRWGWGILRMKR
ncbi:MAG TPA: undecaprenyl-phosphate alpha-N-acetylglucosaminyl 1-phosphate transferase [Gammaproteobacteria bacterium]|nr:undecaprenyl-phosphate alpha-N-acetylglucosaminyl 1-phosphate transferase [Gammaproteobacteria bacterium]